MVRHEPTRSYYQAISPQNPIPVSSHRSYSSVRFLSVEFDHTKSVQRMDCDGDQGMLWPVRTASPRLACPAGPRPTLSPCPGPSPWKPGSSPSAPVRPQGCCAGPRDRSKADTPPETSPYVIYMEMQFNLVNATHKFSLCETVQVRLPGGSWQRSYHSPSA